MMQDGFVALFAAVMKFWERLAAILFLRVAGEKDFAREIGDFLEKARKCLGLKWRDKNERGDCAVNPEENDSIDLRKGLDN